MTRLEFVKSLEAYFEKPLSSERLLALSDFLKEEDFTDGELSGLYKEVLRTYQYNNFPSLQFIVETWNTLRKISRVPKMRKDIEEIAQKNRERINEWWEYKPEKIMNVINYIQSKEEYSFTDKEFKSQFDSLFLEVNIMKEKGWGQQEMIERIVYVLSCLKSGEFYEPLKGERHEIQVGTLRKM